MNLAAIIFSLSIAPLQDAYHAGITLSPDEKTFAVGNCSREIRLFRLSDGKHLRTFSYANQSYGAGFFTKPAFSPDGKLITAGSLAPDGGVNPVWRVADGKVVQRLALWESKDAPWELSVAAFGGDGRMVLGSVYNLGNFGGQLVALDAKTSAVRYLFDKRDQESSSIVAISPAGTLVASKDTETGNVWFWDPIGEEDTRWQSWPVSIEGDAAYMAFSGDGKWLVMGFDGWCARLSPSMYPKEGLVVDTARGIDNTVKPKPSGKIKGFVSRSICASKDGAIAVLGGRYGRIARIDLRTGKLLKVWKAFEQPVKGLALTRDGKKLLSYDLKVVKVWEPATGKLLQTIVTGPKVDYP